MEFILTKVSTDEYQSVIRECVERVKGKVVIDLLIKKVEQTGEPVEIHFEGDYDLKVTK